MIDFDDPDAARLQFALETLTVKAVPVGREAAGRRPHARRRVRGGRPGAAVALLALAALAGIAGTARADVLVSNTDLTSDADTPSDTAQSFRTGAAVGGYTITDVEILLSTASGRNTVVTIRENDSGEPGEIVATLSNPATFVDDAVNVFTASAEITVAGSTTYWVRVNDQVSSNQLRFQIVGDNDQTGEEDWRIGNNRLWRSSGAWLSHTSSLMMAVNGTRAVGSVALSALAVKRGTHDLALAPAFAPDRVEYTASVPNGVSQVTVTQTADDANASVAYVDGVGSALSDADALAPGHQVNLVEGENAIGVKVTAADASANRTYTVTVTRAPPPAVDVPVGLESNHDRIGARFEDLVFTLTRSGATTYALDVEVNIVQDQDWLGSADLVHALTFPAGEAELELTLDYARFSLEPDTAGDLTATASGTAIAGGSKTVEIVSTAEAPITIAYEMPSYTFEENAPIGDVAIYAVATLHADYPRAPWGDVRVLFWTSASTAQSPTDYTAVSMEREFRRIDFVHDGTVFVARQRLLSVNQRNRVEVFDLVDDDIYEGPESFDVLIGIAAGHIHGLLQFAYPDGTTCLGGNFFCNPTPTYEVTITDQEDVPALTLWATPSSIREADDAATPQHLEHQSVVHVQITNGKTFATERTLTLSFAGTAVEGTDYTVVGVDADSGTTGFQVVLPALTAFTAFGVRALNNDVVDGSRTIELAGSLEGTQFGTATLTIADDETTSAGIALTVDVESVGENDAPTEVTVTATLDGATRPSATPVTVEVGSGSATAGTDFAEVTDFEIEIPADTASHSGSFTLDAVQDSIDEGDGESVAVSGTASGLAVAAAEITIADDDTRGVTVSVPSLNIDEGGTGTYTVVLDTQPTGPVTVTPSSGDTGAATVSGALAFSASDWSTEKTVTVTGVADDDAAAETVTVSHAVSGADYAGVAAAHVTATVEDDDSTNRAPVFDPDTATRRVAENTAAGTAIGAVIAEATDADGDTLTYTLEGIDAASFTFDAATRQLDTKAGVDYDHEATKNSYSVTVKADDGRDGTDRIVVTINVTDVNEKPAKPGAPTVTAKVGTRDSLDVEWTAPDPNGGPDIAGYELQYRKAVATDWTAVGSTITGTTHTVGSLPANTEYAVQVRALNGETPSDWSDSGTGTTRANRAPVFDPDTAAREVAENASANTAIGAVIAAATDADGDTVTYSLEGTDAGSFAFDATTRQISTKAGVDYDHEATKNSYSVTVKATDTGNASDTIAVTIDVTDVNEKPAKPGAPTVAAKSGTTDSLNVSWSKPDLNGGPDITGYKLQYRKTAGTPSWTPVASTITGTTHTLGSLSANTEYAVQMRAVNGELDSDWSDSGTGSTGANRAPVFDPDTATREVAENTAADTAIGDPIPAATDADGDTLTYSLEGTDAGSFAFDATTRQISTKAALNHETKDSYAVTLKAADGNGGTDTMAVTIDVTDVDEKPAKPGAPTVAATSNESDSLDVSWSEPGLNGGPAITGYKLRYQADGTTGWTPATPTGTGTTHTLGSLSADTEYAVQVRALNGELDSDWSDSGTGTTGANRAPVFDPDTATREVAENTAAGTAIGAVIAAATDADGDTLTYRLEGTDAGSFAFDATSRQISTKAGVDYDHEATKNSYAVTVKATDTSNASDTIAVTIDVTDVNEKPAKPGAPTVAAKSGTTDSLDVSWSKPDLNGGPDITGYKLRYQADGTASWTPVASTVTGTTHTLGSLSANTEYAVQVRAVNGEQDSDWSDSGTATTGNSAPVFDPDTATREVAENTAADTAIGDAIPAATDADGDTPTYSLEGTDAGSFAFDATTRQISTKAALNHETKDSYAVTVKAADGNGGTDTMAVTIDVTDVDEKPAKPGAPTVAATSNESDSLDVSWSEPGLNGGPAITGYKLQYRKAAGTPSWTPVASTITGTTHTLGSLSADTGYAVQVRALNGELDSDWSDSGTGSTGANRAPVFDPDTATREVAENTAADTAIGDPIPAATDADGDTLTYSLEGTDAGSFAFDATTRQISTKAALNHETKDSYAVTLKAADGNGGTDTMAVTIDVTDVDEKPAKPGAPTVAATSNESDSLDVSWSEPGLNGGPAITGYKLRYQADGTTGWTPATPTGTGTTHTLGSLSADTEYAVQVRALNGELDSDWSDSGTGTTGANRAPVFDPDTATREVAENTAAGTAIGAVIAAATDADGDTLTYRLEGTDAGSFAFDATSRQISTKAGVDYDHEATKNSYAVTVKATDTSNASDTIAVTIDVTDVNEKPAKPGAPTVAAKSGTTDSLDVSWSKPDLNGGPDITGYKLRYQADGTASWTPVASTVTGTTHTLGSLSANTEYAVQVRAVNGEQDSDWSDSGTATTGNSAPVFDPDTATREVAENTAADTAIGDPIPEATDADGDTLTYTLEGTDAGSFAFDATTRQISTKAALNHETKDSYAVTVKAADGNGGTDTIAVTIDVTDVDEKPAKPGAPTVAATSNESDSLDVSWSEPGLNGGPAITGYRLQYQADGTTGWTQATPTGTGTTHTLGSLSAGTEYAVQVRALNGELDSDWSDSGTGTTGANRAPVFDPDTATREVAENTAADTAIGDPIPEATDADGDTLTYSLEGTDAGSFAFDAASRQIRTKAGVDYDHEATKNSYSVTVKATDTGNASDTIAVTIDVTDVNEQPARPGAPTVAATSNESDSLDVSWSEPDLNGGPDITGYRLRYQADGTTGWTPATPTGTTHTIDNLSASTTYAVQVRAVNGELDSDWSDSGTGTTGANRAPVFDPDTATREVAENTAAGTAIGAVIAEATDADGDTLTYTLEGTDAGSFAFDAATRQISTKAGVDYDHEAKNSYSVTVKVTDTGNASDTIAVTIDVTNMNEKPARPGPPTVAARATAVAARADTNESLEVSWSKPDLNGGPDIVGYRVRHRPTGKGSWTETPTLTGTAHTIRGLATDTTYEAQVRALNDGETPSDWSRSGIGRTGEMAQVCDVTMEDVTVHEGETARFSLVISPPLPRDDTLIWWAHTFGDATFPEDFPSTGGFVDVKAGATVVLGEVETYVDNRTEATERFQIAVDYVSWRALPDPLWRESCAAGFVYIRDGESNAPPVFEEGAATMRWVFENAAPGPVGRPVKADDHNDDPLTYALAGSDASLFEIERSTGQLSARAGLDHETAANREVRVEADDGQGGTATIDVTVEVRDVKEKPGTPAAPTVTATPGTADSLDVSWRKPDLAGGPEITAYRLCTGVAGSGTCWTRTLSGTATRATVDELAEDTAYEVQVLAVNEDQARGDWSPPGIGRTGANAPPRFAEGARATRSVDENTAPGRVVGSPVTAVDPEEGRLTYTLDGPDAGSFDIDQRTGQVRTRAALDHESKARHAVTVSADDGEGGTATIEVTVNVGDVDEAPAAPQAPRVDGGETSLSVSWSEPENAGPPVTSYNLRYKETGGSWRAGPAGVAGTTSTIESLSTNTDYAVQVQASNAEGASGWSTSGRGATVSGGRTVRMDDVTVFEGETARFTITFTAARSDEDYVGWYTRDHQARAGGDYRQSDALVYLTAGATQVTGEVETYADDEEEDTELFHISIGYGSIGDEVSFSGNVHIRNGPRPVSIGPTARVVGDLLMLTYPEPLDAGSTPRPKDWVVRGVSDAGPRTMAVIGVAVSGPDAVLELAAPAMPGEAVSVSYLRWPMHPLLVDDGGVEALPFVELAVRNETPRPSPEVEDGTPRFDPVADSLPRDAGEAALDETLPGAAVDSLDLTEHLGWLLQDRPAASVVRLDLPGRELADVSALADLTGLEVLDLSGNVVTDLWPLTRLPSLRRLDLSENRIADVAALAWARRLQVLDLSGNAVADIWPLAELLPLRRLDLSENRIADVSALAGLARLEVLLLDGNAVSDLAPLAQLDSLTHLGLSENGVDDVTLLAALERLERLDLSGNAVTDAAPLGDLGRLVWLDLTGNPVSDAAPLSRLTLLRWLWLDPDTAGIWALARGASRADAPLRIEPPAAARQ